MAIDVNALAEQAFELAKSLTPQAFRTVTLKLGPTMGAYDPATDTRGVTSWEFDSSAVSGLVLKGLPYDDEKERKDQPIEARMKTWLFSLDDIAGIEEIDLDATGELTDATDASNPFVWNIYRTEVDPSRSIVMFYCQT